MTPEQASRVVFVSGTIMAVYVLLRGRKNGADPFRSLWAVGALTLGLAVAADFAPQVAGPFALLVLVAMIARNRGAIGEVIGTAASSSPPAGVPAGNARYAPGSPASSRPG